MEKTRLNVTIHGKDYLLGCNPGEEDAILEAAELLNRRLNDVQRKARVVGAERQAIMAGLDLAHEQLRLSREGAGSGPSPEVSLRVSALRDKIRKVLAEHSQMTI
jgi:cell division protein ZapA